MDGPQYERIECGWCNYGFLDGFKRIDNVSVQTNMKRSEYYVVIGLAKRAYG